MFRVAATAQDFSLASKHGIYRDVFWLLFRRPAGIPHRRVIMLHHVSGLAMRNADMHIDMALLEWAR
jgi:hypothetical protein